MTNKTIRNKKKIIWMLVLVIVILIIVLKPGFKEQNRNSRPKRDLIIFHAVSLSIPFRDISQAFEKNNPGILVKAESAGSRTCAKNITDLKRRCDVFGSADYRVIENLLMPEYADFNIQFALNEMVIAFTDKSNFSNDITADNWHEILLKDDVTFARADPDLDPAGYRTLMIFQLAEQFYNVPGLAEKLYKKNKYVRTVGTDLFVLLETGEIDYLFFYRSAAKQHNLRTLLLSDEINLKSPEFSGFYSSATVKLTGKKQGEFIMRKGEPMIYSVTIPKNAENKEDAEKWVEFLLSPQGRKIMEKHGQFCITPAKADDFDKLPQSLKVLCQ